MFKDDEDTITVASEEEQNESLMENVPTRADGPSTSRAQTGTLPVKELYKVHLQKQIKKCDLEVEHINLQIEKTKLEIQLLHYKLKVG
ncbi:hypothetical protein MHYP_G00203190 [Metynnis hypsauchen]